MKVISSSSCLLRSSITRNLICSHVKTRSSQIKKKKIDTEQGKLAI